MSTTTRRLRGNGSRPPSETLAVRRLRELEAVQDPSGAQRITMNRLRRYLPPNPTAELAAALGLSETEEE